MKADVIATVVSVGVRVEELGDRPGVVFRLATGGKVALLCDEATARSAADVLGKRVRMSVSVELVPTENVA